MLINCSNHPAVHWKETQRSAAAEYGEIIDVPFPMIDPMWSEREIAQMADDYAEKIANMRPDAVLCQGESTFQFALTRRLLKKRIVVLAACSVRVVKEFQNRKNGVGKETLFEFRGFRRYEI